MKKDVLFSLPAEALTGANKICVLGDFNDWKSSKEFELKIQPDGSASTTITLEAGKEYKYRFLINDEKWVNDYHAERYERDANYQIDNCVITVAAAKKSGPIADTATAEVTAEAAPVKKVKTRSAAAAKKTVAKSADKKKTVKAAASKTKAAPTAKTRTRKTTSTARKTETPRS